MRDMRTGRGKSTRRAKLDYWNEIRGLRKLSTSRMQGHALKTPTRSMVAPYFVAAEYQSATLHVQIVRRCKFDISNDAACRSIGQRCLSLWNTKPALRETLRQEVIDRSERISILRSGPSAPNGGRSSVRMGG